MSSLSENVISRIVFNAALRVHRKLGPGLLETVYERCMEYELAKANLLVKRQQALPLLYDTIELNAGYRVDLLIENKVVIELKAVDKLHDIHTAQMLTYLKLSGCKLGLIINFNVRLLKDGVKRVVNNL